MKPLGVLVSIAAVALCATPKLPARMPATNEDRNLRLEAEQRYLILDASRAKDMQKRLDDAAAAGFRVISGASSGRCCNILVLEKDPTGKKHEYRLTDSFNKALKKGEIQGYRVLPQTLDAGDYSVNAVLERLSEGEAQPEYQILNTARTSSLEKDINEWAERGFHLVALSGYKGNFGLMEKVPGSIGHTNHYSLLATSRTGTMQKEIADTVATGGYRLVAATATYREILVALEKQDSGDAKPEYRMLSTSHSDDLELEMTAAAREGYRLLPMAVFAAMTGISLHGEVIVILEKRPSTPSVQYKVIENRQAGTLAKELTEAAGAGWTVSRLILSYRGSVLILEKAGQ